MTCGLLRIEQKVRSIKIDQTIKSEHQAKLKQMNRDVVILGSADSGKTTYLRQITLYYGSQFSSHQVEQFKWGILRSIRKNIVILYQALLVSKRLDQYIPNPTQIKVQDINKVCCKDI